MLSVIIWFRRDLRLADNPAWQLACRSAERLLPVFIHAPDEEGAWPPGAASRWWQHHSLEALARAMRERGSRLIFLRGPSGDALVRLVRECRVGTVAWNRLYEPAMLERDRSVERRLHAAGVETRSFNAALLREPWEVCNRSGGPYRVFTPYWHACKQALEQAEPGRAPARVPPLPRKAPRGEPLSSFGLLPGVRWDAGLAAAWTPGEGGAASALRRFCRSRLKEYAGLRDRPDRAATSQLSPHLHFGELGPRQVVAAVQRRVSRAPAAAAGAEAFLTELGWREFAHHLLYHFPATPERPLDVRFERFPWASRYGEALRAWQRGRTGIPIVDAGMRQLWHTGWMHNRVRMLVASVLVKNLRIPWQEGARWFWDTLVDADLANNTLGWQWTAGCGADAAPYFRVFNPVLQGRRFDPEGRYVRRWVPELGALGDRAIHAPWETGPIPSGYPPPLVDLTQSRKLALAAYDRVRRA